VPVPVLAPTGNGPSIGTPIPHRSTGERRFAFHAALNDTVTGAHGVVTTTKVGRATRSAKSRLAPITWWFLHGQPIYLLRNVGGGDWKIWVNGRFPTAIHSQPGLLHGRQAELGQCALTIVQQPETVWWPRFVTRAAAKGWTREVDHFRQYRRCG